MRRNIFSLLVSLLFLFLTVACNTDDDGYSLGDFWISLGFVETENTNGYEFILYTDKGDTLLPAANAVPYFKTSQNKRVLINYTILDEVGNSKNKFYIKINDLRSVLYKDIFELNNQNKDSIGNDPIHVTDVWLSDSILNMEFQYYGGNTVHFINLTINENDLQIKNEPINLTLLHNANNDQSNLALNGIASFNLNKLKKEGQDSVSFQLLYTDYQNQTHNIKGTYKY